METTPERFEARRRRMVEHQLRRRGIADKAVLAAMERVPRHRFVQPHEADLAYEDQPLPIGSGQTISQPYMVAFMMEAARIKPGHRVLDVGTGSGYAAAVAAEIGAAVFSIERSATLGEAAKDRLAAMGYEVRVTIGDGSLGWAANAPYDVILVAAAAHTLPPLLTEQLAAGGRLIVPVGPQSSAQTLQRLTRTAEGLASETLSMVRFVPLVSE